MIQRFARDVSVSWSQSVHGAHNTSGQLGPHVDARRRPGVEPPTAQNKDDKKAGDAGLNPGSAPGAGAGLPARRRGDEGDGRRHLLVRLGRPRRSPTAPQPQAAPGRCAARVEERLPQGAERADLRAVHGADRAGQARDAVGGRLSARRAEGHDRLRSRRPRPPTRRTQGRKDRARAYPFEDVYFTDLRGGGRAAPEADARLCGAGRHLRRLRRAARASRAQARRRTRRSRSRC